MIITISGKPGSGKSTIAKLIAQKYDLKHYSTGDFFRKNAQDMGLTLEQYSALAEQSRDIDNMTDRWQEDLGKQEDDFIIDGRMSHNFIKDSIKIFLDVDKKTGAIRIMNHKRTDQEKAETEEKAIEMWEFRSNSEQKRYKDYYGINLYDFSQYDLVLNTSNMTPEMILEKLSQFIDKNLTVINN